MRGWAQEIIPNGRVLRPQDLGMLAAAGVTSVRVHRRPVVTIFSTGDEVVPPETETLRPGQVRDATAAALAALVADAGGAPVHGGIVPDDPAPWRTRSARRSEPATCCVISAGSSVGARDETANAVARLGAAGHLVPRPGDQAGQAHPAGRVRPVPGEAAIPVIGLPGNPRSALVVFRLIGMDLVRLVGGCTVPPPGAVGPGQAGAGPRVRHRAAGRRAGDGAADGVGHAGVRRCRRYCRC